MIKLHEENKKLIFHYEVLRARLEIREFFLKTTVKEVYENVGQVLSLVRMQLAYLEPKSIGKSIEEISSSGDLVGQTIRDLRSMCRSFYPDLDIIEKGGCIEALESTIKCLELSDTNKIKVKGTPREISPGLKLIIFKMLQEILISIKETDGKYISTNISFKEEAITFSMRYIGSELEFAADKSSEALNKNLSLYERVELIDGKFSVRKNKAGPTHITLNTPLNNSYE